MIAVVVRLSGGFSCPNRIAECLKQRTVHGVGLRIVFGMPLHAERKSRRILEPYRLDRPVLCNAFGNDPVAKLENALSMQEFTRIVSRPRMRANIPSCIS